MERNRGSNVVDQYSRPDNCDGTYEQFCDMSRQYSNITQILQAQGKDDTLNYMMKYFKDYKGDDESFWEHEWNKHGTCMSTFETKCYMNYMPQQEVGDYFTKLVELFKGLNTYKVGVYLVLSLSGYRLSLYLDPR